MSRSNMSMGSLSHNHRNSFSAATYTSQFGAPSHPPPRPSGPARSASIECPWPVYAMDWSKWGRLGSSSSSGSGSGSGSLAGSRDSGNAGHIAIGSFCDDIGNRVQVLRVGDDGEVVKCAEIDATLPYPVTKVMWEPPRSDKLDATMIATSGDYLRLFSITQGDGRTMGKISQEVLLGNTKADFPAPLTSFDWNQIDPSIIVTASVDTTCTVWDLNTAQARTQLIAHDREVFDVTFTAGSVDVFASVGADGSVRLFDLRALEHSTIIYESPSVGRTPHSGRSPAGVKKGGSSPSGSSPAPLLRLSACERDENLLATFHVDSNVIQVLDIRQPGSPILELDAHVASVNAVQWSPQSRNLLASAGDDSQVLIWDCNAPVESSNGSSRLREPALAWTADSEVNNISWGPGGDRVAATLGKIVQALKI